jgi:xanthine dehydrogenase accessory factor
MYSEILSALEIEDHVMLATIISTTGSTPASALSKMLVIQNGSVSVGTVGGGCMEGDVLLHANRLYNSRKAEILTFHLNEDDIEHGLICGGSLDVLIEPITKVQRPLIEKLKSLRDDGNDCVIATMIDSHGTAREKMLIDPGNPPSTEELASRIAYPVLGMSDLLERAYRRQETQRLKLHDAELILEPVMGTPGLIVFGGGHVSKFVSRAAAMTGFNVTIIDDREKYANKLRFPEASQTLAIDYLDAFEHLSITSSTYIVIVTRGHRYDQDILKKALATPAKYIGMIGSKRKVMKTFEHLIELGVDRASLRRVHAPIGLEIGALTAEEIGISIVAQLINVRRECPVSFYDKSKDVQELLHFPEQRSVT